MTTLSMSLAWNASTDNVGVAGYGVYLAGVRVGTVTPRSYAFAGLLCGTTYALGVDAVDAAGNRSARASSSGTTSACPLRLRLPLGVATIQPGQSWQLAYTAAPENSTLKVAAGNPAAEPPGGSKKVTFLGAEGAVPDALDNLASNVTLDNVDIDGGWTKVTILWNSGDNNIYKNLEIRDNTDIQMISNTGSYATTTTFSPRRSHDNRRRERRRTHGMLVVERAEPDRPQQRLPGLRGHGSVDYPR